METIRRLPWLDAGPMMLVDLGDELNWYLDQLITNLIFTPKKSQIFPVFLQNWLKNEIHINLPLVSTL